MFASPEVRPFWRFFSGANLAAAKVHELHILPENTDDVCKRYYGPERWMADPLVPAKEFIGKEQQEHYQDRPSLEQTRENDLLLIDAVKQMKNLTRFEWYRSPPPVTDELWDALGRLGSLAKLDVVDELLLENTSGAAWVKSLAFVKSARFRVPGSQPERAQRLHSLHLCL